MRGVIKFFFLSCSFISLGYSQKTGTKALASPDGYEREVIAINGMFPGPVIEANTGDTIIVHVNNGLDEGQGLHWHGLRQKDTALMDGVPGITQGRTNCTATGSPSCTNPPFPEIPVPVNSRIRLRFISGSSHVFYRMSLDNHPLEVVETDGTAVYGPMLHEVSISSGERYSAIINTFDGNNQINNPLLRVVQGGGSCNSTLITNATFPDLGEVNIILNNLDAKIPHPYHLHGNEIQLLARGTGSLSLDDLPHINLNLDNPLRKDTFWMEGGSWVVMRLVTDNPGVWALHCHIGWHLAKGKVGDDVIFPTNLVTNCSAQLAVVVVQPQEIEQIRWPQPCSVMALIPTHLVQRGVHFLDSLMPYSTAVNRS
ncbi:Cu-oxidase [Cryptococcus gattii E566]|nr:Cu-oxidase [Cryptococcus gattii E566]